MAESKRKRLLTNTVVWLILFAVVAVPVAYHVLQEECFDVTAVVLTRGHVEQTVTAISSGTVKARLSSMVASGYVGKITAIPVKEGDHVKAGDVLVELEHGDLDAQVTLAEANLRVGRSRLEQAKIAASIYEEIAKTRVSQTLAQSNLAKLDFERIQSLSAKKAVSQSDLDKVTMAMRVAQENHAAATASQQENRVRQEEIRSAEAAIQQLEAALTVAQQVREKAIVRAPFDGVVAKVFVDVGESIGAGAVSGTSMPTMSLGASQSLSTPGALVELLQNSDFYVKAPFDEANAAQIWVGQKARIGLDAYRGADFPGLVEFVSPVVTRNPDLSRTLDIDVTIKEGQDKFIVGMSADVILVASEKDDVLFAPSQSLIREEDAYVVENGRAVRRRVKIGIGNWQRTEIVEGLREGETLITSTGVKGLKNGARVRVVDSLD